MKIQNPIAAFIPDLGDTGALPVSPEALQRHLLAWMAQNQPHALLLGPLPPGYYLHAHRFPVIEVLPTERPLDAEASDCQLEFLLRSPRRSGKVLVSVTEEEPDRLYRWMLAQADLALTLSPRLGADIPALGEDSSPPVRNLLALFA